VPPRAHSSSGRRRGAVAAAIALTLAAGAAPAAAQGAEEVDGSPHPFAVGEQLLYEVSWLGIVAGTAKLVVEAPLPTDTPPAYRINSRARSNQFFSRIFAVDDQVESVVEASPFRSLRFTKRLREGTRQRDEEIVFDPVRQVATTAGQEVATPPMVQDALSALYHLRTQPLAVGNSLKLPVHSGGRNYDLQVDVLARERIRTPFGERLAFKVEPHQGYEGVFDKRGRLFVWIGDDAGRLPLLMRTELPIGAIVARLVEYEWAPPVPAAAEPPAAPR
jgi:hypothetical protein